MQQNIIVLKLFVIYLLFFFKAYSTQYSQVFSHLSTHQTWPWLASKISGNQVHLGCYGHRLKIILEFIKSEVCSFEKKRERIFILKITPAVSACAAQLPPTLCDPVDRSPPGSSGHGILQAGTLEWVAVSFSRGSSQPRGQTHVSCVSCNAGSFFTTEPPGKP